MRLLPVVLLTAVHCYNIGIAVTDLTPTQKEIDTHGIFLGGYGEVGDRDGKIGFARGVHDKVWARAAAIDDFDEDGGSSNVLGELRKSYHGSGVSSTRTTPGQTLVVLAVIDGIGMGSILLNHIRGNVTLLQPKINKDNVLISLTHSHSAPDFQGLWAGVMQEYRDRVVLTAAKTIVDAYNARVPARIFASQGVGYNHNRRDWGWAQNITTILDIRDKTTDARLGAIVQFTAHPTTVGAGNLNISSDWINYFRNTAEASLKAPVLYFNGPIGDVSPAPKNGSDFVGAENYGSDIANITLGTMNNQTEITGQIYLSTVHFNQTVTNLKFVLAGKYTPLLNNYYASYPLNETAVLFPTQTSYFHFGKKLQGLAFPGESLTRNAEPILEHMLAPFRVFLGLNGDTLGYFVPSDEWEDGRHGGYEESVSTNRFAGDDELARMLDMISKDPFPPSVK